MLTGYVLAAAALIRCASRTPARVTARSDRSRGVEVVVTQHAAVDVRIRLAIGMRERQREGFLGTLVGPVSHCTSMRLPPRSSANPTCSG
jgi:hypothetical protein